MTPVGYEPTISAGERSQTHALDGAATGTGTQYDLRYIINYQYASIAVAIILRVGLLEYQEHNSTMLIIIKATATCL
jgi:hypothetical protein